ncbi:Glycogen synthase [Paraconexibacter sp. AEG42_29]|uniref:Glycogen synthase n=1 Tax=Paraconexibacter sp. AEG42_29 TaxID=2997339 RepID=A0AAU7B2E9_9ACTN
MRVCLVYDCLFPWTVGGAERRMRELAEALAAAGHEVTYLTRLQWPLADPPAIDGVRVVAVSRDEPLYGPDGNRTIGEPLRFGFGVLRHLARHGREYDVVHTASFPYFSLLAAGAVRRRGRYRLVTDWHEVWSPEYWRTYVGGPQGVVAHQIQRACARIRQTPFAFSRLHADRLVDEGLRGTPAVIWEEWADDARAVLAEPAPAVVAAPEPVVVFAGRFIAEKQAPLAVAAMALAAAEVPGLRGVVLGDGPERDAVQAAVAAARSAGAVVDAPGFVETAELHETIRGALCLLAPTRREGYGLVVIEAASLGVPIVLAAGADNAATELIEEGVNGFVCADDSAEALAAAVVRVHAAGPELRRTTLEWHRRHLERVVAQDPLQRILDAYSAPPPMPR